MKLSTIFLIIMIVIRIILMFLYSIGFITREMFKFDILSDTLYLGILAIVSAIKELKEDDD